MVSIHRHHHGGSVGIQVGLLYERVGGCLVGRGAGALVIPERHWARGVTGEGQRRRHGVVPMARAGLVAELWLRAKGKGEVQPAQDLRSNDEVKQLCWRSRDECTETARQLSRSAWGQNYGHRPRDPPKLSTRGACRLQRGASPLNGIALGHRMLVEQQGCGARVDKHLGVGEATDQDMLQVVAVSMAPYCREEGVVPRLILRVQRLLTVPNRCGQEVVLRVQHRRWHGS